MKLNYGPRLGEFALQALEDDKRFNILVGSVRSGKTWALHPKIIAACHYPVAGWRFLTGASKQSIFTNVLNDLFNLIGPRNYSYNQQSGLLTLFGTKWMVMGAKDEGSEKFLRGATIGVAVCDEVVLMPWGFFQMLQTRLSPAGARLYGTTNPDSPMHPLKLWLDDPRNAPFLFHGRYTMDDNPNLPEDFKDALKASFTGMFYQRYILGNWVMADGAVYADVLGDRCRYDDDSRPIGLYSSFAARYIGVDYGTTNPCVFLDVYDDGKTLWEDKEYYWDSQARQKQKTDAEYADDLVEFVGPNRRGTIVIVDPSAASFKTELIRRGFLVKDAKNEVEEGIRKTSSALHSGRYRIHRRNVKTYAEMEAYVWDARAAARGLEQPLKQNDHGPDARRYVIHTMVPDWRIG